MDDFRTEVRGLRLRAGVAGGWPGGCARRPVLRSHCRHYALWPDLFRGAVGLARRGATGGDPRGVGMRNGWSNHCGLWRWWRYDRRLTVLACVLASVLASYGMSGCHATAGA